MDEEAKHHAEAEKQIVADDSAATNFRWQRILTEFVGSTVYYVEYDSKNTKPEDCYFYVLFDGKGELRLFDDGTEVIERLQGILDKRRSIVQRIGDFSFFDIVAAVIAMSVTATFIYLMIMVPEQGKDFGSVFGIVAGYYFGKNVPSKRNE